MPAGTYLYACFCSHYPTSDTIIFVSICSSFVGSDINARGLERSAIQRHGKDQPLGSIVFRRVDDVR